MVKINVDSGLIVPIGEMHQVQGKNFSLLCHKRACFGAHLLNINLYFRQRNSVFSCCNLKFNT